MTLVPSCYNVNIITHKPQSLSERSFSCIAVEEVKHVGSEAKEPDLTRLYGQGDFNTMNRGWGGKRSWFSTPPMTRPAVILSCSLSFVRSDCLGRERGACAAGMNRVGVCLKETGHQGWSFFVLVCWFIEGMNLTYCLPAGVKNTVFLQQTLCFLKTLDPHNDASVANLWFENA